MPPSAIVSVPVPRLPMMTPELLLQVEPAPVTITVPMRARDRADVGGEAGVIDDRPTVCDRKRTRAKTADIEPARAQGCCSKRSPVQSQSPRHSNRQKSDGAAAATVHRAAVLDGKRAST